MKALCVALNWVAGVLSLLWIIPRLPVPQGLGLALALLPVFMLAVIGCCRGKATMEASNSRGNFTVAIAFYAPIFALSVRTGFDLAGVFENGWHVLRWENFRMPFAIFSLGICALTFLLAWRVLPKNWRIAGLFLMFMAYGFAATLSLNFIMDQSSPRTYQAKVLNGDVIYGHRGHISRHLTLSAWALNPAQADVLVSRDLYQKYPRGATADIAVREGKFGIRYYYVK